MAAGIPVWRVDALTNSELAAALRAAGARHKRERDMAVFLAWRTATLIRAKKKIPALSRLLRSLTRRSRAEQAEIRAHMADAEAEFARLEAAARRRDVADAR